MATGHQFCVLGVNRLRVNTVLILSGLKDLEFKINFGQPNDGLWPSNTALVYRNHISIRPLRTRIDERGFCVKLYPCSAPKDFAFALKLVCAVAQSCEAMIIANDSAPMSISTFSQCFDANWAKYECLRAIKAVLNSVATKQETMISLRGVNSAIDVGPRMIAALKHDSGSMAHAFFKRFKLLNYIDQLTTCHEPLTNILPTPEYTYFAAIYVEGCAAVIKDNNTLVNLGPSSLETLKNADHDVISKSDHILIPLDLLAMQLGRKVYLLSEDLLYLPSLQGDAWRNLIDALAPHRITDPLAQGYCKKRKISRSAQRYSDILVYGPIVAFFLVAAASNALSQKNIDRFKEKTLPRHKSDSVLFMYAKKTLLANYQNLTTGFKSGQVNAVTMMVNVNAALDDINNEEEADLYRHDVLSLAKKVARTGSGKTSNEDTNAALDLLEIMLFTHEVTM